MGRDESDSRILSRRTVLRTTGSVASGALFAGTGSAEALLMAKTGILIASLVAGLGGYLLLHRAGRTPAPVVTAEPQSAP